MFSCLRVRGPRWPAKSHQRRSCDGTVRCPTSTEGPRLAPITKVFGDRPVGSSGPFRPAVFQNATLTRNRKKIGLSVSHRDSSHRDSKIHFDSISFVLVPFIQFKILFSLRLDHYCQIASPTGCPSSAPESHAINAPAPPRRANFIIRIPCQMVFGVVD